MKRFSVFALLMAVAIGFTYALAYAGPSVSTAQAKSACGCTDCRCPDCNGEFCTCEVCECGNCACLKASGTSNAPASCHDLLCRRLQGDCEGPLRLRSLQVPGL